MDAAAMSAPRLIVLVLGGVLMLAACTPGASAPSPAPESAPSNGDAVATDASPSLSDELRVSTSGWATDFSRHDVPLNEFLSGGPGKDGIPALDEPKFEPLSNGGWLEDQEPLIAVGIDGQWRAYPIQILVWHEIVNDTLAGVPITVTFCPLCHTSIVFDRELDGVVYDFGTTGNLRHSDLVMYDRQTESWWQQATGRAIVGELTGAQLEFLPSELISWEQFRTLHPDGELLSRDTGHIRSYGANPYAGYDTAESEPFLLDDRTLIDGRLNPKVRIVGVVIGEESVAYPLPDVASVGVVNDTVGGDPIVVLWSPGTASGLGAETVAGGELVGSAVVLSREAEDGTTLEFEPADEGRMRDTATGSVWTIDGRAIDGPMAGAQLELVTNDQPFWFAWAIFRPDTTIWQP
jgi:hypothetical protein